MTNPFFRTVRGKVLAIVVPGLGISLFVLIASQTLHELARLEAAANAMNRNMTELTALHAGDALKRRDEAGLENLYFDIVFDNSTHTERPDLIAVQAVDTDGERLKSYLSLEHLAFPTARLTELANDAVRSEQLVEMNLRGAHVIAAPVWDGRYDKELVGALVLAWDTERLLTSVRSAGYKNAALAAVICLLLIMLIVSLLQRMVIRPIGELTEHVLSIAKTGDLTPMPLKAIQRPRDEIGLLGSEFDRMLAQLAEARRRLLDQTFQSGMAEMAAGVMHNIRNALSPIAVSLWRLSESVRSLPVPHLDRALSELGAEDVLPERRMKLAHFASEAVRSMLAKNEELARELAHVAEQNRHIERILNDHTALSLGARELEAVDLSAVLNEAARLIASGMPGHVSVSLDPKLGTLPPIRGHSVILTQVIGNLFVNAAEAVHEAGIDLGLVEVEASRALIEDVDMIRVRIADNGAGIDPSVLPRLFERGFSTKKGKTGGLGLHWSANSIAAMGGRMEAGNRVPGGGAVFDIVLPIATTETRAAA